MLCLELALVVVGYSYAAAADGSPLSPRGQGTGAPNEVSVALSPSDGESVLDGLVGGGGFTLAGGYREFFVMADVNYTQTDMGFDDRFRALIASARAGWNGKVGPIPLRLWVGGAYWDTKNTVASTVDVPDVGVVRFEADQGPKNPWNAVVGISSALHRHFEFFAEYGFSPGDLTFFAGGLTARF